ncbi:EF-hand domain-containing protein [Colwellia sp. E2M01]|uniref:EF-hand domain-containing protein n=1 Tax=Colwellia sp. E2M01 TaxID=2841561 RepID=UPI001C091592|nr:EF-hand domain-containing protein [Colwellia sp. E2M01]MBU2871547.1 EF-hand domain-containing protein [Colwellia sp. E2M01]
MNQYSKLVLSIAIVISTATTVQAENAEHSKNGPPQRPTFEQLDINQDSEIDFEEFSSQEIPHGDHQTIFDMIDIDGSGFISNEEFVNHKPPQPKKRHQKEQ